MLSGIELVLTFLALGAGTLLTRAVPFVVFPEGKKRPPIVDYLGKVLPPAMIGFLIVYCLKETEVTAWPYGIPELLSIAVTAGLHIWRGNFLISIAAGTLFYMFLIQNIF